MSCCGVSICAVCNPTCSCFDVFCGGSLTGTTCTPNVCVPVSGIPGGSCAGAAPHLCDLPLTNPNCTYGFGTTDPITSPCGHGAVDTPPCPSATWACPQCSRAGLGSGAGTAASQFAKRPSCGNYQNVGSLLSRWGTAFTSLLGGGKQQITTPYAGRSVSSMSAGPTSFGFLIMMLVAGFILWKLAFSERG